MKLLLQIPWAEPVVHTAITYRALKEVHLLKILTEETWKGSVPLEHRTLFADSKEKDCGLSS